MLILTLPRFGRILFSASRARCLSLGACPGGGDWTRPPSHIAYIFRYDAPIGASSKKCTRTRSVT